MPESVELATILLTDLVGSTRLATAVGPAHADRLREEHFGVLRHAIGSCGGREVKNTGDGLMVAFTSASAAVECAVSMQQLLERRYRKTEHRLRARIGLGAGESTVKDGDYFGTPTIEAARLCGEAPPDGILVSAAVKMLAGRCEGVEFATVGPLELKGFGEPVQACSVSWTPLAEESSQLLGGWPLPAQLRSLPSVAYVGRLAERAMLEGALAEARTGARQLVLLSGEPGIGKTRLATYAAHQAHAQGFAVCWGASSEDLAVPYEPWIEVCTHLVEHAPQELVEVHVDRHGGELQRLARNLAARAQGLPEPQASDTETERYLLFSAVVGLLRGVSEAMPLCVVLDDLHWADGQSLALLKHLVRGVERGALKVIATYRDSDVGKDHPLSGMLADLRTVDGVRRLSLRGLARGEVAEIVTAVSGHELDADGVALADEIAQETDGNPFFVGELLRGLRESGGLVYDEDAGRWNVRGEARRALPESVREVIERRVERLGAQAANTLRLAAVIGRAFDVDLLAASSDVEEAHLLDHLEAAVSASLLSESTERIGQFSFAHALINQTLYEGLGATRRARMHHSVAVALEQLADGDRGERLGELAMHWRLATSAVDVRKAAGYARLAGQQALERLAPADAARLFADALELAGEEQTVERCEALVGLGEAQRQTGDPAYRDTLLQAARVASVLQDGELAARAALASSRGSYSLIGEVDAERLAAIARAIELDDPPVLARRARLLALEAQELEWSGDLVRRRALADEAVSLAREAGDPRALGGVLLNAFYAYWSPETLELRRSVAKELVESTAAAQDPALGFWAHVLMFNVELETGRFESAHGALMRSQAIAEELGQPILNWIATYNRAGWAQPREDMASARQLAERAFELGQLAGEPDAVFIYGAQLASVSAYDGRGAEIVEMLEQSVSAYPDFAAWRAGLAHVYCMVGRHADAAGLVEQAAADRFEHVPRDQTYTTAIALYADAASQANVPEAAAALYELIEPWADQFVWNGATGFGHARTWLGLLAGTLGWPERADEHLGSACELQEANGVLLWAAYARLCWGEQLARRGEADRSREQGARAFELAREYGYGAFEDRAAALVAGRSLA
jgi:class 3 adenylate cyclase